MSLYYIKPIVWNSNGYQSPSGARFISGYPGEYGFGHEEWNNSPRLLLEENGEPFRIFYTEPSFGNQPIDDYLGDIFLFMIASHEKRQYLVGVAGSATSLFNDEQECERLVEEHDLGGEEWLEEAWNIQNVKSCFNNNKAKFRGHFKWLPTWKCPANLFLWLEKPMPLDATEITGKKRLITMYSGCQEISRNTALNILNNIPNNAANTEILANLRTRCIGNELDTQTDIVTIQRDTQLEATTKQALIQARLGQGRFREDLMQIWNRACAVTGCAIPQLLKASHIKPWRDSTNRQRLDPNNGLLLVANIDALFDSGLISFEDSGEMLVSRRLPTDERIRLGVPQPLRIAPNQQQRHYLMHHRQHILV